MASCGSTAGSAGAVEAAAGAGTSAGVGVFPSCVVSVGSGFSADSAGRSSWGVSFDPESAETGSARSSVGSSVESPEGSSVPDSVGAGADDVSEVLSVAAGEVDSASGTGEVAASGACSVGVGAADSSRTVGWMVCSVSGWFRSVTGCSFMG